eukprot:7569221-Pyramimonas_sp.AAC.2
MKDGRLKKSVICRRWLKDQCPFSRDDCQCLRPKRAAPAQQQKRGQTQAATPGSTHGGASWKGQGRQW